MKVPIVYVYIYHKLKKKNKGLVVKRKDLKKVIVQHLICSYRTKEGVVGGSKKGLPKEYIYDIIKDMESLLLIEKMNRVRYKILSNKCEKRLKKMIWD